MLTREQIDSYRENGYLTVENVISPHVVAEARTVVDAFVERARVVTAHDDVYDLEPGHSANDPRVRRLKDPCLHHPVFAGICCTDSLLDIVAGLIGPAIRYQGSKLNMKAARYGSPVEWHQDFAFYPHTNDDLLAVGIALDDCTLENGCMLMVPGSHRGPILDHHQDGVFVGAVDVDRHEIDVDRAVPVMVGAGGISVHHCRMLHASATNRSGLPRRLLLLQLAAVDAFPVFGVTDLSQFDSWVLRGCPVQSYRVKSMDIRLPLPKHERQGSIYEIQSRFSAKLFGADQV